MWKQFLHDYLSFTKKERTGIFIVIIIIVMCLVLPFLYPYFIPEKTYDHSAFAKEISKLKIQQADSTRGNRYYNRNLDPDSYTNYYEPSEKNYYPGSSGELFYFDPNIASTGDWRRLGIKEKTAETIRKYLSKGGHFYKPEDIGKIWGLHKKDIERLLPYVRIGNSIKEYANDKTDLQNIYSPVNYPDKKPALQVLDINTSDTTGFIALPGIGSKLAQRIIAFREKLGGFYSLDQIRETYGIADSTFVKLRSKLILTNPSVKKININSATLEELKSHPYIRYNLANAILQYRFQHGNFSTLADIKKIMTITDEMFDKVLPYLTVN